MKNRRVTALLCISLTLASQTVRAGPPFTTNDPDPPDVRQWEFILPFMLKRAKDGSRSGEFVTLDINNRPWIRDGGG